MLDSELLDILVRIQGELFMMLSDVDDFIASPRHRKLLQGIIGGIDAYLAAQSPTLSDDKP